MQSTKSTGMSICRSTESPWYRKLWSPWGKVIGYHDERYVEIEGVDDDGKKVVVTIKISKHFTKAGHVKFYVWLRNGSEIVRCRSYRKLRCMAIEWTVKKGEVDNVSS